MMLGSQSECYCGSVPRRLPVQWWAQSQPQWLYLGGREVQGLRESKEGVMIKPW